MASANVTIFLIASGVRQQLQQVGLSHDPYQRPLVGDGERADLVINHQLRGLADRRIPTNRNDDPAHERADGKPVKV